MSRRRKNNDKSSGSPQWMTTFSDLMTLLLTFFILLYSFSSVDAEKFKSIASSLQNALIGQGTTSVFENGGSGESPIEDMSPTTPPITDPQDPTGEVNDETKELYNVVQEFITQEDLEAEVTLRSDRRGVIIDIKEAILFDSGRADLKEDSIEVLGKVTSLINEFDNKIIVEGHTDNVPMRSARFPTNWELSMTRATNVVRYFIEERNMEPTRLSAAGYGEYSPIAPNDNRENRALNRRVNILIVTPQEGEEPSGTGTD